MACPSVCTCAWRSWITLSDVCRSDEQRVLMLQDVQHRRLCADLCSCRSRLKPRRTGLSLVTLPPGTLSIQTSSLLFSHTEVCLRKRNHRLCDHDHLRRHLGGSREVRPLSEADLRPALHGVHALGRRVRGHRLPGFHSRSLVPGPGGGGEEAGVQLEPGGQPQADGAAGEQLRSPAAEHLRAVRGGLEPHGTHLWLTGTGPERNPHNRLQERLGVRLWGEAVLCYWGERASNTWEKPDSRYKTRSVLLITFSSPRWEDDDLW